MSVNAGQEINEQSIQQPGTMVGTGDLGSAQLV